MIPALLDRARLSTLVGKDSLGRASMLSALGSGAGRAAGLIAGLGAAAVLGSAEFGVFTYLTATAALISMLGVLGFGPLVTRAVAAGPDTLEVRQIAAAVLLVTTALLAVAGCAVAAVASVTPIGMLHGSGLVAALLWALGLGTSTVVTAVLTGHRRFTVVTVLTVVRAVASGSAVYAASVTTADAAVAALAAGTAETLLAAVGVLVLIQRRYLATFPARLLCSRVTGLITPAVSAGIAGLAIYGVGWLVQITLLLRPDGLAENGAFGLACRLSLIGSFLPSTLAGAAVPYLGRQSPPAARALARRIVRFGLGTATLVSLTLAAASPMLNEAFGPSYAGYAATTALMACASLTVSANALLSSVAVGLGRLRHWIVSDLVLAAVMAAAALVLVPALGASGAAASHLISYAVSAAYLAVRLRSRAESQP
ncbi:oligosaccharide flippase family protein [Actinoplanes sp. NPDC024001]|uniref:lipopolysaccharide biosynthesis protein n=1 Tax=Actinoplanes sp. NPDC024001 TaxID=3154598 RepID=UPI0033DAA593